MSTKGSKRNPYPERSTLDKPYHEPEPTCKPGHQPRDNMTRIPLPSPVMIPSQQHASSASLFRAPAPQSSPLNLVDRIFDNFASVGVYAGLVGRRGPRSGRPSVQSSRHRTHPPASQTLTQTLDPTLRNVVGSV